MNQPLQITQTPCSACDRETRHSILFSTTESEYEYRVDTIFEVVECCGCGTKSFRKVVVWIDDAEQIDDEEWYVPTDVKNYPSILEGHKVVPEIERVPEIVGDIYRESLDALKSQSKILAGIGLRATIEAICNEQGVTGRNLEQRIDKLARVGLISRNDADRLHAIRFLGNDSAHEIKAAYPKSLLVALRAIEHLILSLYILDSDADGVLETLIKTYEEFVKLLNNKVSSFTTGEELPLAKLLGHDARRFHGYLKSHEAELMSNISTGNYSALKLGKFDSYAGSQDKRQHFIVI
jgi:hypothetical protein